MRRAKSCSYPLLIAAVLFGHCAVAESLPSRGEVVLFPSAEAHTFDGAESLDGSSEGSLSANVLANWTAGKFRLLGEFLLSTEEQELERLLLGWEVVPDTRVWLGRFHQPASFWNTRDHHGQYLQTSITRPAIENWEDDEGVLPQHVEGLMVESRLSVGRSRGVMISASAGIGPVLHDGELEPEQILDPRSEDRGGSGSLQVAYLLDYAGNDGIGLLASHSEIMLTDPVKPYAADHVDLDVAGLYLDIAPGAWRVRSATYWVRSAFDGGGDEQGDSFASGYLQVQRSFNGGFIALARVEASDGADQSAYIALFDDFVERRYVADLRWDFAQRHALTVEWADTQTLHDHYREYRLQWSAVLR